MCFSLVLEISAQGHLATLLLGCGEAWHHTTMHHDRIAWPILSRGVHSLHCNLKARGAGKEEPRPQDFFSDVSRELTSSAQLYFLKAPASGVTSQAGDAAQAFLCLAYIPRHLLPFKKPTVLILYKSLSKTIQAFPTTHLKMIPVSVHNSILRLLCFPMFITAATPVLDPQV